MKTLIVYDSYYGNTKKMAEELKKGIEGEVVVLNASDAIKENIKEVDYLIIGSPTRAFSATSNIKKFIKNNKKTNFDKMKIAVFDTRMNVDEAPKILKFLASKFGFATNKMEKWLLKAGGKIAIKSEGFFVTEIQGPLKEGEIDRAKTWLVQIY